MKNFKILCILFLIVGCATKEEKKSANEIEAEINEVFNEFYEDYKRFDVEKFTSFYQDDVIRMGKDGEYQVGKKVFKESWYDNIKKYDLVLLDYSQPTILPSNDQTVTFNTYHELFIDKKTRDTTEIRGTWIGIWKKQEDGSWKLSMTTWH